MADNEVNITVNLNGPYIVNGQITLMDADGNEFQVKGDRFTLVCSRPRLYSSTPVTPHQRPV